MTQREYEDFFEKAFNKEFGNCEDHTFVRYNDSLGCYTYGKDHYKRELKRRRLLPYEASLELAERIDKTEKPVTYDNLPASYKEIISSLKATADKDGNIQLGGRAIEALMKIGAIDNVKRDVSKFNETVGGFSL